MRGARPRAASSSIPSPSASNPTSDSCVRSRRSRSRAGAGLPSRATSSARSSLQSNAGVRIETTTIARQAPKQPLAVSPRTASFDALAYDGLSESLIHRTSESRTAPTRAANAAGTLSRTQGAEGADAAEGVEGTGATGSMAVPGARTVSATGADAALSAGNARVATPTSGTLRLSSKSVAGFAVSTATMRPFQTSYPATESVSTPHVPCTRTWVTRASGPTRALTRRTIGSSSASALTSRSARPTSTSRRLLRAATTNRSVILGANTRPSATRCSASVSTRSFGAGRRAEVSPCWTSVTTGAAGAAGAVARAATVAMTSAAVSREGTRAARESVAHAAVARSSRETESRGGKRVDIVGEGRPLRDESPRGRATTVAPAPAAAYAANEPPFDGRYRADHADDRTRLFLRRPGDRSSGYPAGRPSARRAGADGRRCWRGAGGRRGTTWRRDRKRSGRAHSAGGHADRRDPARHGAAHEFRRARRAVAAVRGGRRHPRGTAGAARRGQAIGGGDRRVRRRGTGPIPAPRAARRMARARDARRGRDGRRRRAAGTDESERHGRLGRRSVWSLLPTGEARSPDAGDDA